jgi:hypothetical protein
LAPNHELEVVDYVLMVDDVNQPQKMANQVVMDLDEMTRMNLNDVNQVVERWCHGPVEQ